MSEKIIDLSLDVDTNDGDLYQKGSTDTGIQFSLTNTGNLNVQTDGRPGQPKITILDGEVYATSVTLDRAEKLVDSVRKLAFGMSAMSRTTNGPPQYGSKQHEFLNFRNKRFSQNRAYLSNDYVEANVQGLNPDDFYEWAYKYVRFSDIAQSSSMSTRRTDDWKEVMFPQEDITYFPIGAKLITMGNTWLNVNPSNMNGAYATAIMARCNSSFNCYDYYGNIVTEPIYEGAYELNKTANYVEVHHIRLMDGNVQITCQYNEITKKLGETKRLIIGSKAYYITGYDDSIQEFTGDRNSVHLLTFTARVDEPTDKDDMTDTFIANGKSETFEAVLNMPDLLKVGYTMQAHPLFVHNGATIAPTSIKPLTWEFATDNANVAQINSDGQIEGISAGTANITATLKENPSLSVTVNITVREAETLAHVEFEEYKDTTITQFTTNEYTAHFYDENGEKTDEPLEWAVTGGDYHNCYAYAVEDDGLTVAITCISPSKTPIAVTAKHGDYEAILKLELEGY